MGQRTAILFKEPILPERISLFKEKRITSFQKPGYFKTRLFKVLAAALVVIFGLLLLTVPTWAGTDFIVNSTADDTDAILQDNVCDSNASTAGQQCTLRAAIQQANSTPNGILGPDTIKFNISGSGVHKISPRSYFPDILDPVVIDGYTQPGASENTLAHGNNAKLLIELDGTDAETASGLIIAASNSTVRGLVINNFVHDGIVIGHARSGNKVQGKYIGADATGKEDLGNSRIGVWVAGANNTVGGPGAPNIISNNRDGIRISSSGNWIEGNYIGTDVTGTQDLGNSGAGVWVSGANNTIGGTSPGARNIIAFNDRDGVAIVVSTGTGNSISSNSIFSNGGLGIDLGDNGVTANDQGDGDTGPNDLQTFPELRSAAPSNGNTTIEGTLDSASGSGFTFQFFSSPDKDPSGHGEGKKYLGQQSVTTDSRGKADVSFTTNQVPAGEFVTATATHSSNPASTSEYSNAVAVNTPPETGSQSVTTGEDEAKTITLSATDAEGDELNFEITDQPDHGTLGSIGAVTCDNVTTSCQANLTYTPNKDYHGSDSFKFLASDWTADSGEATVSITVSATNDAPVADDDSASTQEDTAVDVDVLDGDSDPESDTLSVTDVTDPAHATATVNADGTVKYEPDANYNGPDSFTYEASDGNGGSDTATVTITVTPVNDAPTVTVAAGGQCDASAMTGTINLTIGDVESEADGLIVSATSSNQRLVPNSSISSGGSGAGRTLTVKVQPKRSGTATLTLTVSDGDKTSSIPITVKVGSDSRDTLTGTSEADMIFGKNGNDTINALEGNDLICGGNGAGTMSGGAGDDTLDGAKGNDVLRGDEGKDILRGGSGDDTLTGGTEADSFSGGAGTDAALDFGSAEGDTNDGTIP
jgi:Ca2+-binding RTX toxin-like protein